MANKPRAKLASTKPVSTKWLQNAMRSIGISTKNALKVDFAPNIYTAVESGLETSKSIISSLKRNASGTNHLTSQLQNNKYVKFAQKVYKNALADLKSGNFHNEDRAMEAFMGDMGDMDSWFNDDNDSGFSFGDDGASSVDVNIVNASGNEDATFAMTTHLQKQTEATLKTSQANMNAMIAINSAAMQQNHQTGTAIISGLDAINKNISSLIEYNNSNMNKFIESSLAFYERMGATFDKSDSSTKNEKISANKVLNNTSGGINVANYKKYVKQQMKKMLSETGLDMIDVLLDDDNLEIAASNPLGFVTDGLVKFLMPKILTNTIKGVEETFSSFMPAMLHKLSEWGEGIALTPVDHIKQFIGKTFGLRIDRKKGIDKSIRVEKGPIPFDGQTKFAITEIITKELREQTAYLKAIAGSYKIGGKKGKSIEDIRGEAEVFDPLSGKYMKVKDITDNILSTIANSVIGEFDRTKFGKGLRSVSYNAENDSERNYIDSVIDKLVLRLEKDVIPDINKDTLHDKESDIVKLLAEVTNNNKDLQKLLIDKLEDMSVNDPNAIMSASTARLRAQAKRNETMKDIEEDPYTYNTYAAIGLDDANIDDLVSKWQEKQINESRATFVKDAKGKFTKSESRTGEINKKSNDPESTFNKMLTQTKDGLGQMALGILHGSPNEAFSEFVTMVGNQFNTIWEKFSDSFVTPMKTTLFGKKDSDNFSRDGILSGVINKFKDASGLLTHYITGKSFKDSTGTMHEKDPNQPSVFDIFKEIGSSVKEGVLTKLFGEKEVIKDEKGNVVSVGKRTGTGLLSKFKNAFEEGIVGWQEAFFGKKLDEKERENLKESLVKNLNERLPDTVAGAAIGTGVGAAAGGSLLGTLVGGPIGGVAIGSALGFASKSEKFQEYLFGKKDEETGERLGGFISKKVQDYYKENKNSLIGGAAVGTVTGSITGGGLLGSLVGGPVAGAILGIGSSILLKSETFKEFLYGNEATGQVGIKEKLAKLFSFKPKDDNTNSEIGKSFGMGAIGAGAGALTGAIIGKMGILGASLSPLGPVGGALAGLGLSIYAQKDNFHQWLFGKKDEKGNKVEEGLIGRFGNMLKVNVMNPMKSAMSAFAEDLRLTVKYDILDEIRFAIEPIGTAIKEGIVEPIKQKMNDMFTKLKDAVLNSKIIKGLDEYIISPIRKAISGVTKVVWGVTKKIIAAPFKLIGNIGKLLTNGFVKILGGIGKGLYNGIVKPIAGLVNKAVIKPFTFVFGKIFKGIGAGIKGIFNGVAGVTNYIGDKINRVGKSDEEIAQRDRKAKDQKEERKWRQEEKKVEKANAKKHARENRIHDENSRMIARATNYQYIEDTEENRERARLALGKNKIDWRIDAKKEPEKKASTEGLSEDDILKSDFSKLDNESKQTNILVRINDTINKIFGVVDDKDKPDNEGDKNNKDKNEPENKKDSTSDEDTVTDADRIKNEIEQSGGLFKYTKEKLANSKLGKKFSNSKFSKFLGNTKNFLGAKTSNLANALNTWDDGDVYADGGVAEKDKLGLVGEKPVVGKDEAKAITEPEIVSLSKGTVVYANAKPFNVVVTDIAESVKTGLLGLINKFKGNESSETNTDSGDVRDLATRAAKLTGSNAAEIVSDLHGGKSGEQAEDDMAATIAEIESDKKHSKAIEDGLTAEERKKKLEEKDKDDEENKATLNNIAETQEEHAETWSSVFSKKGLITSALILAIPLLIKHFPAIAEGIGNIGKGITNLWKFISNFFGNSSESNLGDGDSSYDKVLENVDRLTDFATTGNTLNEDGQIDHMTGSLENTKLVLAKEALKPKHAIYGINYMNAKAINNLMNNKKYTIDQIAKMLGKTPDEVSKVVGSKKNWLGIDKKYSIADIAKKMDISNEDLVKKFADAGDKNSKFILNNSLEMSSDVATAVAKNADDTVEAAGKATINIADNAGTTIVKNADNVVKAGANVVGEATEKVVTSAAKNVAEELVDNKTTKKKVIDMITDFLESIGKNSIEKAAAKASKKAAKNIAKESGGIVSKILSKVMKPVKEALDKGFAKISKKIAAVFLKEGSEKALYLAGGIGIAIDVITIVGGGLNGLTGAGRLFGIAKDKVDWLMRLISGLWGAARETLVGAVIDIVNELVVSVSGTDIIRWFSSLIYNAIMTALSVFDEDIAKKVDELAAAQEDFSTQYSEYRESEILKQYETMTNAGIIDKKSVSFEDYKTGINEGKYSVKYDSQADYTDKQNKTALAVVGDAFSSFGNSIKTGWENLFGKTDKYLTDNKGNKYYDNGNGTYQIISSDGKDLGYISKESVPKDAATIEERKSGSLVKYDSNIITIYKNNKDKSYYDSEGNHYSSSGELIGKISTTELSNLIRTGKVTRSTMKTSEKSGKGGDATFANIKNAGGAVTAQELLDQYRITSNYGPRVLDKGQETHHGVDLAKAVNSPVASFTSGKVFKVVNTEKPNSGGLDKKGYGNYVVIKDEKGNQHYYAHLNETSVKSGDTVEVGDKIGLLGHTGRSTGAHLHYEIRSATSTSSSNRQTYNPIEYLKNNTNENATLATTTSNANSTSPSTVEPAKSGTGILDIFGKIGEFFGEVSKRALSGLLTGNFNSDYSDFFNNSSSSTSASITDNSPVIKINGSSEAQNIWKYYKDKGIPENTIAGMLANMYAESSLNSRNLQNTYESKLGYNDMSYTSAVDNGKYSNFASDSAGYGLVQWTYGSLKQALLNYAKQKGTSIGDRDMQLEFLVKQLKESYPSTWAKMLQASTPEEASTIMLTEFEKPAKLNTNTRANYAKQYYEKYASKSGMGGAKIKPRIIKNDKMENVGGPGSIIDSVKSAFNSNKEYITANIASKFIDRTNDTGITKAINMIISLLEEITGNTASTSTKLDMLQNIKSTNITLGGNTPNNNTANNNGSKQSSDIGRILTGGQPSKSGPSRNQKIAERIAQGV